MDIRIMMVYRRVDYIQIRIELKLLLTIKRFSRARPYQKIQNYS